jgi:hypothetical protein
VVLLGGETTAGTLLNDTWAWNGAAWANQTPVDPAESPPERKGHALATLSSGIILFGGQNGAALFNDTWAWDGFKWRQLSTTGPQARYGAAMAFDEVRNRVVLFGGMKAGSLRSSETWEWNPTTMAWEQKTPNTTDAPPARDGHVMSYNAARGTVVMFGGEGECDRTLDIPCADTWEWDGSGWNDVAPSDPEGDSNPQLILDAAAAYDAAAARMVLFGGIVGGYDFGVPLADTWLFEGGATEKSGHVFTVEYGAADTDGTEQLKSVNVRFVAGGTGYASGSKIAGVVLGLWDRGAFQTFTTHDTAATDAPATIEATLSDASALSRIQREPTKSITFSVTPKANPGTGITRGVVLTDYAEVTVKYRLP